MLKIPNLTLFDKIFDPLHNQSLDLDCDGLLISHEGTYSPEEAQRLSRKAGSELKSGLLHIYSTSPQKKITDDEKTDLETELEPYRTDMIFNTFSALGTVIDRITRLQMDSSNLTPAFRKEQDGHLNATLLLARFIEEALIIPFLESFGRSNLRIVSKELPEIKRCAAMGLHSRPQITQVAERQTRYTEAREAVLKRLFDPYVRPD